MSSNHYETALSVLRAVEQHDEPGVAKLLSDDFEHKIYPPSMHGIIGRPWITNKDETLKTIFRDRVLITRFGYDLDNICESVVGKDGVVIEVDCNGEWINGKPYTQHYVFIFKFNDDGLVRSCNAVIDSAYTLGVMSQDWAQQAVKNAMKEQKKNSA